MNRMDNQTEIKFRMLLGKCADHLRGLVQQLRYEHEDPYLDEQLNPGFSRILADLIRECENEAIYETKPIVNKPDGLFILRAGGWCATEKEEVNEHTWNYHKSKAK